MAATVVKTVQAVTRDVKVLILGAGCSGLGAAVHFHKNNINDFLVVEGNDYIGGRVKSATFSGETVSLGAGSIHSADRNHKFYQLSQKYGLRMVKDDYSAKNVVYRDMSNGTKYAEDIVTKEHRDFLSKLKLVDLMIERKTKQVGCYNIDLKNALTEVGWTANNRLRKAIEYFIIEFENGEESVNMSAKNYSFTGQGYDGTDYIVADKRGYIHPLLEEIKPFQNKILLNHGVTTIEKLHGRKKYMAYFENGKSITADYILTTFSSGVLQSNTVKFIPKLPTWKREAFKMVPMSHYSRIFLKFEKKFWDDATYIIFASNFSEKNYHWTNFKQKGLYPDTNILLATITGEASYKLQDRADKEIKEELTRALKCVYPDTIEPSEMLHHNFTTDPRFMGAYSHHANGKTRDDVVALQHPVDQRLWFTGEYIADYELGYTHIAYELGEQQARNIINCMNGQLPAAEPKFDMEEKSDYLD